VIARLFDDTGVLLVATLDVSKPFPPYLNWADHEEFQERLYSRPFAMGPHAAHDMPRPIIRRFGFLGVEVDKDGEWARYQEEGRGR